MTENEKDYNVKLVNQMHNKAKQNKGKIYSYRNLFNDDFTKDNYGYSVFNITQGYVSKDGFFIAPNVVDKDGKSQSKVYKLDDEAKKAFKDAKYDSYGYAKSAVNSQGLIQVPLSNDNPNVRAYKFMAGPKGAQINQKHMKPDELTGTYVLDSDSEFTMQQDFKNIVPQYAENTYGEPDTNPGGGLNTYVDPTSRLVAERRMPRYTMLYNSTLNLKNDKHGTFLVDNPHVVSLNAKDSHLNFEGNYEIEDANLYHVNTPKTKPGQPLKFSKADIMISNLDHVNLDNPDRILESKITGGTLRDNTYVADSVIKQNAKSVLKNATVDGSYMVKDNLNDKDLTPQTDLNEANVLNNAIVNNSVLHADKNPVLMQDSSLRSGMVFNGLTSANSQLDGKENTPIVLDGVVAENNKVEPEKLITKFKGMLPTGETYKDAQISGKHMPTLKRDTPATDELLDREFKPFYPVKDSVKYIVAGIRRYTHEQDLQNVVDNAFTSENQVNYSASLADQIRQSSPIDDIIDNL